MPIKVAISLREMNSKNENGVMRWSFPSIADRFHKLLILSRSERATFRAGAPDSQWLPMVCHGWPATLLQGVPPNAPQHTGATGIPACPSIARLGTGKLATAAAVGDAHRVRDPPSSMVCFGCCCQATMHDPRLTQHAGGQAFLPVQPQRKATDKNVCPPVTVRQECLQHCLAAAAPTSLLSSTPSCGTCRAVAHAQLPSARHGHPRGCVRPARAAASPATAFAGGRAGGHRGPTARRAIPRACRC
jgi:hypothetical protein